MPVTRPLRIGISSCLLGRNVRYDGGHKHDPYLTETIGRHVTFVPVCPEVDIGLGIPREPIRLVRTPAGIRLASSDGGRDLTEAMTRYAERKTAELGDQDLSGFILKKDSPSCGMERVKVFPPTGVPVRNGRGLFARGLMERFPLLPVEEEGRLQDPDLRENFFVRVFAYRRMMDFLASPWKVKDAIAFHSREKFLLLSHSADAYQALGRWVAGAKEKPRRAFAETYAASFMEALRTPASIKRRTNALQHMAGFLKKAISSDERRELDEAIQDYRRGLAPLAVPLTLLRHQARRNKTAYLLDQTLLNPHPKEFLLG